MGKAAHTIGEMKGAYGRGIADGIAPKTTAALDNAGAAAANAASAALEPKTDINNLTFRGEVKTGAIDLDNSKASLGDVKISDANLRNSNIRTEVDTGALTLKEGSQASLGHISIHGASNIENVTLESRVETGRIEASGGSVVRAGGLSIGR